VTTLDALQRLLVDAVRERRVAHLIANLIEHVEAAKKGSLAGFERHGKLSLRNRDTHPALECIPAP
jgi:hypothetical protein